jgi:predicted AAA+ superfamily ATPase
MCLVSNDNMKENILDLTEISFRESTQRTYECFVKMRNQLPPQIERQQPVLFLDAFGHQYPFHLEFITSLEVIDTEQCSYCILC